MHTDEFTPHCRPPSGKPGLPPLQVTLLHVVSEEEESLSSHYFKVDALVENVTLLITGTLSECKLSSPSGNSAAGSQRCTLMIEC